MAVIKSYTSLEQSFKLAEILPLESADACWTNHLFDCLLSSWRVESTPPQEYKCLLDRFVVSGYLIEPAWSLAALFEFIPNDTTLLHFDNVFSMVHDNNKPYYITEEYNEPLDACYEMILKLHELRML